MNLITDVHYHANGAQAAGILFEWESDKIYGEFTVAIDQVEEYEPGMFYRRELPCLTSLIQEVPLQEISHIIIDGFVFLNDEEEPGLGKRLYDYLNKKIPVIGIAKTGYHGIVKNVKEVNRGISVKPLFVTSVGIDLAKAASMVQTMHGANRLPTMVSLVDQLSRKHL